MATIFEEANNPNPTPQDGGNSSFLEQYVGEGKKYRDVEELAKAYHNADTFIPKLKTDLDALKEFTLAQLAERADANKNQPDPNAGNPNDDGGEANSQRPPASPPKEGKGEEVDLNERIRQVVEERDENKRFAENARRTEDAMVLHFGSKEAAVEAVRAKAAELEVSPQWLADTAFRSPKAFLTQMGITEEAPRSRNTPAPVSNVNPLMLDKANPGIKPGTYAYYDNIRRTDPAKYRSLEVQKALMDDAMRLGNDFFKR